MLRVLGEWLVCLVAAGCVWFLIAYFNGWLPLFFDDISAGPLPGVGWVGDAALDAHTWFLVKLAIGVAIVGGLFWAAR